MAPGKQIEKALEIKEIDLEFDENKVH